MQFFDFMDVDLNFMDVGLEAFTFQGLAHHKVQEGYTLPFTQTLCHFHLK